MSRDTDSAAAPPRSARRRRARAPARAGAREGEGGARAEGGVVLVVSPSGREARELLAALRVRADLEVVRAASVDEAAARLAGGAVGVLVAADDLTAAAVTALLAVRDRRRPGLPVLLVRERQAEAPADWARAGVGILRRPLLADALVRSVELVLEPRAPGGRRRSAAGRTR